METTTTPSSNVRCNEGFTLSLKKVMVLAILTLTAYFSYAQFKPAMEASVLNLRMSNDMPFRVMIDGISINTTDSRATISNIPAGRHFMQVYSIDNSWGFECLDNAYRGYIDINPRTESFVTVLAGMNKIKFDRVVALNGLPINRPGVFNWTAQNQPGPGQCGTPVVHTPVAPVVAPAPLPMHQNDFTQLKSTIANAGFESTRMSILKQALPYNFFTTQQVAEMMNQFWFESSKLEVAKLMYPKTLDQYNYYVINNQFSFSSSVNALGNFIAMNQ